MAILETLTKKQRKVFDFIRSEIDSKGYGPTVREIADKFGIGTPNGVNCHLRALQKKGAITRVANQARTLALTSEVTTECCGLPLSGRVAAGAMKDAVEASERLDVGSLFVRQNLFVVEVTDHSLSHEHIAKGDYLVISKRRKAKAGDVVLTEAANGESVLKPWGQNSKVRIVGVLAGVVRKF